MQQLKASASQRDDVQKHLEELQKKQKWINEIKNEMRNILEI